MNVDDRAMASGLSSATDKVKKMGSELSSVGAGLTAAVTVPIVGIGAAAIKTGMDFEVSMQKVAALSGATGSDLQGLEDLAKKMGRETSKTATEAADALGYMA